MTEPAENHDMSTKPPHLSFEWFRSEMLKAVNVTQPSDRQEAQIRELWDMARESGRRAAEAVHNETTSA